MDELKFAYCIVHPGSTALDMVFAAKQHSVLILDNENFDPQKNYQLARRGYKLHNGVEVAPLFVFPDESLLAEDEQSFQKALSRLAGIEGR